MKRSRGLTLIELLVVLVIIAAIIGACGGLMGGCSKSDGDRAGIVVKFSHKGIIKSWEGELALAGNAGQPVMAAPFQFTVKDDAVVKKVQAALDSGKRVKLHYDQAFMRNPLSQDTTYVITDVTELDK